MAKKTKKTKSKKKVRKNIDFGRIYISASFNNTLINITDEEGNTLMWGSAGSSGFKGTRKSTPFAATTAVDRVISRAKNDLGLKEVEVFIKGPGPGRDSSLRAIKAGGLKISAISDVTPMPHNGPRPKKRRRV